jgi:hypothetical protein
MPGISASVGVRNGIQCYNVVADQQTIQRLLDQIPAASGGSVDSSDWTPAQPKVCARDLQQAILSFQNVNRSQLPYAPDGHVDPGGGTIQLMNRLADNAAGSGPGGSSPTYYEADDDVSVRPPGPLPVIGAPGGDWFVTGFSVSNVSLVVAAGVTWIDGSIEFSDGLNKASDKIKMWGPSIGLSYTPNVGKYASKIPGVSRIVGRFPAIAKILSYDENTKGLDLYGGKLFNLMTVQTRMVARALVGNLRMQQLLATLTANRSGVSGGAASWPSYAIGVVSGRSGRPVRAADFLGNCVCFGLGGSAGGGFAAGVASYALWFGVDPGWSPFPTTDDFLLPGVAWLNRLDAKSSGAALFMSATVSAGFPSLGATMTVCYGSIE